MDKERTWGYIYHVGLIDKMAKLVPLPKMLSLYVAKNVRQKNKMDVTRQLVSSSVLMRSNINVTLPTIMFCCIDCRICLHYCKLSTVRHNVYFCSGPHQMLGPVNKPRLITIKLVKAEPFVTNQPTN